VIRKLTHHPDGHKLPPVGLHLSRDNMSCRTLEIWVNLPCGWEWLIVLGFEFSPTRYKLLQNGDAVDYNEPIASDNWRDQLFRPNGTRW
jgi:hypothetical protein